MAILALSLCACTSGGSSEDSNLDAGGSSSDAVEAAQDVVAAIEDQITPSDASNASSEADAQESSGGVDAGAGPDANIEEPPAVDVGESASMGAWASGACTTQIEGTGNVAGDIALDFSQMDQFGGMLRLHDYCDKVVLLIGSAYW